MHHGAMKGVRGRYKAVKPNGDGQFVTNPGNGFPAQLISADVRLVASSFVGLHGRREQADYDDSIAIDDTEAAAAVEQAEAAFQAWLTARPADPSSETFLQELICRSIIL